MDTQVEQQRSALHRAWWVAMSGEHEDWRAVCAEIERRGHPDPQRWFDTRRLRQKMNDVCLAAREAQPVAENHPVWAVIQKNHIGGWMRDFTAVADSHLGSADDRWLAKIEGAGVTVRRGWDEIARSMQSDIRNDPDVCPYLAYLTTFDNRVLHEVGEMAWVTFDLDFPTADLPFFHGPGRGHVLSTLEKVRGEWKLATFCVVDDNFGQSLAPIWQVDRRGRVSQQNFAASELLDEGDQAAMRGGMLHLLETKADDALRQALSDLADMDWGTMEVGHAIPVVYDPGNDVPVSIWWAGRRGGRLYVTTNNVELVTARLELAASALGLSPSQHRLAAAIVEGLSLPEAAKREGVRPSTARTQLQRVFDKLGVRGQPALVRSLLSVATS